MSDANLQVGIDGRGAQAGASTVVRSLNDILNAAANADNKIKMVEHDLARLGMSSPGLSQAKQRMNELNSSGQDLKKLLVSIEDRFIRIGATSLGMWAVKQVFDALTRPLSTSIKYLADMETASLGIASSLLVVGNYTDQISGKVIKGQTALNLAQHESKDIVEQLKVANMNTIATLDELIVAYQTALPVAMAKGFDKKQVLDFTLAMVQAAGAIGLPFNQMSEEIRSLLTEGAINPRNSRIATVLGLRNEDLREYKNNAQGLFDFLMGKLEGFTVAGQQSQNTMKGIWSNIIDVAKQLGGTAFEGVFVSLRTEMKAALDDIVTFDNVAKKANWDKEWVEGAKSLNEWLTTTFNSLVSIAKTLIEHRDLILTVVKAYVAYQVVSTLSLTISKLTSISIGKETSALVAKMTALKTLGVTESQLLTVQQQSAIAKNEMRLADGATLTQQAERIAAHKAEVISINEGIQAKIKEQTASIQNMKVARWEIGLEQDLIATKISQQRANAELLVQERLLAESRLASASAYAASSVVANGAAWSQEALAIEKTERDLLAAAVARETEAKMALHTTMTNLAGLEAREISLKASQIATQEALLKSKVKAIEMDYAATVATDKYNASLAANGAAHLAVTKAQVTKAQTDWVYMSNQQRMIAFEVAHTEALDMNTAAKYANSFANKVLTASTNLLNSALTLIGGPIGALVIGIGALSYAWIKLSEAEEAYQSKRLKKIDNSPLTKARDEYDEVVKRLAEAKARDEKEKNPKKFAKTAEEERQNRLKITENELLKEKLRLESELKDMEDGGVAKSGDWLPASNKDIQRQKEKIQYIEKEIYGIRKYSNATVEAQKELDKLTKYTTNSKQPEDKESLKAAEKSLEKLKNGYEQWQLMAIRTGKVEDELGSKVLSHQQAVNNLLKDTANAKGASADQYRAGIKQYLDETIAIETNIDMKKKGFAVLNSMRESELSNNESYFKNTQLLYERGIITEDEYVTAQSLAKTNALKVEEKFLERKLVIFETLNLNTKDKIDTELALEKNRNDQMSALDDAELLRLREASRKRSELRQREFDKIERINAFKKAQNAYKVGVGKMDSYEGGVSDVESDLKRLQAQKAYYETEIKSGGKQLDIINLQENLKTVNNEIEITKLNLKRMVEERTWSSGLAQGFKSYAEEAMNIGSQLKESIVNAFKGMENALTTFVTTGKLSFKDLANSMMEDMVRMSIQASITGPLSAAFSGLFGQASGGVWESGIQKFALGGIVNSPTLFKTSTGLGVMGEAGTEAIMPVTRTQDGSLGVKATGTQQTDLNVEVNVINQGSQQQDAKVSNPRFDGRKYVVDVILQDVENGGPLRSLMVSGKGAY